MQRNKRPRPSVLPSPTANLSALGLSTSQFIFPHSICLCWHVMINFLLPLCVRYVETFGWVFSFLIWWITTWTRPLSITQFLYHCKGQLS
jgi:hypothetical protein